MPKPNLKTIYLVTSGDYSDYRVCGVFSSVELATLFIEAACLAGTWLCTTKEDFHIETYEVDDPLHYLLRNDAKVRFVFWFDFDFSLAKQVCNKLLEPPPPKHLLEDWNDDKGNRIGWKVSVGALPNESEKAFKIATDILHQHRAQVLDAKT